MLDLLPCALVVAALALATDLADRTIPNALTLPAVVLGLVAQCVVHGPGGLVIGLLGVLIGAGLLLGPFVAGFMGAGDVKLMAALGALLGPLGALAVVLIASLTAGCLAVTTAAHLGQLRQAWRGASHLVRPPGERRVESIGSLPFAVPIAVGVALVEPFLAALAR
ncbi:MAG: A24 family peptidase [Candidatus Eiseniibacteriota bacterium]|jgi:prepilin peptidase CpaA